MKRTILAAFLCLLLTPPAWAGFDELWAGYKRGDAAYSRGDYTTAFREWHPLAEQGFSDAQLNLGRMYVRGAGVPQDYAEAVRWWRKAAEQGHPHAEYFLGVSYQSGEGVPQDYAEAVKWYRKAAEQGDAEAQFSLGVMYHSGKGVLQDYAEVVKWYRKAAGQGIAKAQFNLGTMYGSGQGLPQNYAKAMKWYRRAAEQGDAGAQNNLGALYYFGQGVPQNYVQAHKWANLAATLGNKDSAKKRDNVAKRMTPAQIAEAQKLSREWWAAFEKRSKTKPATTMSIQPSPSNGVSGLEKSARAGSGKSRLGLARRYVAGGLTPKTEREAARWLRKIVADEQTEYLLPAMLLMGKIGRSLHGEFPDISDAAIKQARGSVGLALARKGDKTRGLTVTIREALLLNPTAQSYLGVIYQYPVKGYRRHDPRILGFFRKTASEKLPRSMLFLGKILLNGWGVKTDVIGAKKLLEASGFGEAYMELASYAFAQKNTRAVEGYLKKAAARDVPKAHYNLGVLAKNRGEYNEAIRRYRKTLELDPDYHVAKLNLAQLYSGEFGITGKETLAFEMMKKLADEVDGPISATAQLNVGYFYLDGKGVNRSVDMAKKYLKKAAAGGIEAARKKLLEIQ